jgi:hypothetical protein
MEKASGEALLFPRSLFLACNSFEMFAVDKVVELVLAAQ